MTYRCQSCHELLNEMQLFYSVRERKNYHVQVALVSTTPKVWSVRGICGVAELVKEPEETEYSNFLGRIGFGLNHMPGRVDPT